REREDSGFVLDRRELEVVRERERDVDVGDAAVRLAERGGYAGRAAGPDADGPVDGRPLADLRLPLAADSVEVVGEVVGRPRPVAAVDDRDRRVRNALALVESLDRGRIPGLDLAEEDVGEDRPAQPDPVRPF